MPTQDQMNSIKSLTEQFFDAVHYTKLADFNAITAPSFKVTYPDGSTIDGTQLIARATTRNLEESGYQRNLSYGPMTSDGTTITEHVTDMDTANLLAADRGPTAQSESSQRTLTWMQNDSGNWVLASEHIDSITESPYGTQYND